MPRRINTIIIPLLLLLPLLITYRDVLCPDNGHGHVCGQVDVHLVSQGPELRQPLLGDHEHHPQLLRLARRLAEKLKYARPAIDGVTGAIFIICEFRSND